MNRQPMPENAYYYDEFPTEHEPCCHDCGCYGGHFADCLIAEPCPECQRTDGAHDPGCLAIE